MDHIKGACSVVFFLIFRLLQVKLLGHSGKKCISHINSPNNKLWRIEIGKKLVNISLKSQNILRHEWKLWIEVNMVLTFSFLCFWTWLLSLFLYCSRSEILVSVCCFRAKWGVNGAQGPASDGRDASMCWLVTWCPSYCSYLTFIFHKCNGGNMPA